MREHVTPYMKLQKHPNTELLGCPLKQDWSSYRVTVDMPDDLELVRRLIENYGAYKMNMKEIIDLLKKDSQLQEINCEVHQKSWKK
jgi:spore coat polysaccharide biosynthesis protein SpsF